MMLLAAGLVTTGLVTAACGASSSGTSAAGAAAGGSGAVVVATHDSPLGTYLTDAGGRTLYVFAADTAGASTCIGQCATYWPPLTTSGAPTADGKAAAAMLGTTTRTDGSTQVTYAGHPLYYYAQDAAAGDQKGQGSNGSGAKWWIVSPSGESITKIVAAGSSSSSPAATRKAGGWA